MLSNFLTGLCSSTLLAAEASAEQSNFSPHGTDASNAASACIVINRLTVPTFESIYLG